ncbi:UNVERIFIED_CONTAM: hypothetical protein FKN15_014617 [Acipenser sinensis]
MDILYRVHDGEKLGLAQVPNLALLSYATTCPNKQCWVSEVILKHAYSASDFAARLGNYNSILVAYQYHLLRSLYENHRPSPQQLDELRLVKKNLLCVSKLNGQAVVDEMLQRSHHARESTKELVRLLPKRPPPVTLGPSSLKDRHCQRVIRKPATHEGDGVTMPNVIALMGYAMCQSWIGEVIELTIAGGVTKGVTGGVTM